MLPVSSLVHPSWGNAVARSRTSALTEAQGRSRPTPGPGLASTQGPATGLVPRSDPDWRGPSLVLEFDAAPGLPVPAASLSLASLSLASRVLLLPAVSAPGAGPGIPASRPPRSALAPPSLTASPPFLNWSVRLRSSPIVCLPLVCGRAFRLQSGTSGPLGLVFWIFKSRAGPGPESPAERASRRGTCAGIPTPGREATP